MILVFDLSLYFTSVVDEFRILFLSSSSHSFFMLERESWVVIGIWFLLFFARGVFSPGVCFGFGVSNSVSEFKVAKYPVKSS